VTLPRILIVKTGAAAPEVSREHGDFEGWFMDALGAPERFALATAYDAASDRAVPLPDFRSFDGVIVTGSPSSVTEPTPWMEALAARMRDHAESGGALLGVCFGHQLLCHAFGTRVIRNPSGREIGTVRVTLTEAGRADPLFEGMGPTLTVNCTHVDRAERLPSGGDLLALNDNSPVQALRVGPRARGVQFHPEITAPAMRALIRSRAVPMRSEGLDASACEASVQGAPDGVAVLRHFETRLCGR
jgi:GMP synthase (glutamine-hydrolysing)